MNKIFKNNFKGKCDDSGSTNEETQQLNQI